MIFGEWGGPELAALDRAEVLSTAFSLLADAITPEGLTSGFVAFDFTVGAATVAILLDDDFAVRTFAFVTGKRAFVPTRQLFLAWSSAHWNWVFARFSFVDGKHHQAEPSAWACFLQLGSFLASPTWACMTHLLTEMETTVQLLATNILTSIRLLSTSNDILIFPTVALYHMFFLARVALPCVAVPFTFMLATVEKFPTLLITLERYSFLTALYPSLVFPTMTLDSTSVILTRRAFSWVTWHWA
jgi:hypothetical protein